MDNKKIGELIAKLRKENGLTQQQLGDKVGVGSRAVSKWECGITVPDISIINELSEILGISSNELLSGELKTKKESKTNSKVKPTIKKRNIVIIILTFITGIITIIINKTTKVDTYSISAEEHEKYQIEGYITRKNREVTLFIKEFTINDVGLTNSKFKNYQYDIMLDGKYMYGYGQNEEDINSRRVYNIIDIEKSIINRYVKNIDTTVKELSNQELSILLSAVDINGNDYQNEIKIKLYENDN